MAVLLHDRPEAAGQKQREALRLPRTSAVVALFAFSSRMDRDSMRLSPGPMGTRFAPRPLHRRVRRYWSCCTAAFARRCLCSTPC